MESLDVMDIKQHNVKSIVNVLRFSAGESGLMTFSQDCLKTGLYSWVRK
mgnify:CR=1 FL=1